MIVLDIVRSNGLVDELRNCPIVGDPKVDTFPITLDCV
jgi:hypothetical protein